ncbi:MAG: carbon-nitrogen family hydrolase [Selenomonadaceae bacterium]|nr:carbon-nitrogen family hydrolase [Selenomonadaceae bacterium]
MIVSIAQFKSELGKVYENFSTAARLIEAAQGSDVILLPELWSTDYYPTPVETFADIDGIKTKEFLCAAAKRFNVNIIGGSVIVQSGGKIFNRCHVVNRRGEIVAAYDKTHLFSFAGEDKVFNAGDKVSVVTLDGVCCGVAICYDLRFPEFIRKIALAGAEIIFIPAAWSLKRLTPRQILTKARAIENQAFVVFANSSGKSEVVNPRGEVIAESGRGEELLTAQINLDERAKVIATMNLLADRNLSVDA